MIQITDVEMNYVNTSFFVLCAVVGHHEYELKCAFNIRYLFLKYVFS